MVGSGNLGKLTHSIENVRNILVEGEKGECGAVTQSLLGWLGSSWKIGG